MEKIIKDLDNGMKRNAVCDKHKIHLSSLNRMLTKIKYTAPFLPKNNYLINEFKINSKISAYIAGLYWADGHLAKDRLTITFNSKDEHIIKTINSYFFGEQLIAYKYSKNKPYVRLSIYHGGIRNDFQKLGLASNDDRSLPKFSIKYFWSFFHGLLDGDGNIGKSTGIVSVAGRIFMLKQLQKILLTGGIRSAVYESSKSKRMKDRKVRRYGSLQIGYYYSYELYRKIYYDTPKGIYLERKIEMLKIKFGCREKEIENFKTKYKDTEIRKLIKSKNLTKEEKNNIRFAFPNCFIKKVDALNIAQDYIKEIRLSLEEGKSSFEIAKIIDVSESSIDRIIEANKLDRQAHIERELLISEKNKIQYERQITGISVEDIVIKYGFSSVKRARTILPRVKKLPEVRNDIFNIPFNADSCFWLGFIINRHSINSKYITFKIKDSLKKVLHGFFKWVYKFHYPKPIKMEKNYLKFSIGSKDFQEKLINLGLGSSKFMKTVKMIPKEHHKAFVKGYLVSKLSISRIKTGYWGRLPGSNRFSDNEDFLKWIKNYLYINGIHCSLEKARSRLAINKPSFDCLLEYFGQDILII